LIPISSSSRNIFFRALRAITIFRIWQFFSLIALILEKVMIFPKDYEAARLSREADIHMGWFQGGWQSLSGVGILFESFLQVTKITPGFTPIR
jgi:hypothetical protein